MEQADSAASALQAITTTALPFDAVVLDLRLPDMKDLSLLATIRQLMPRGAGGVDDGVWDAGASGQTPGSWA